MTLLAIRPYHYHMYSFGKDGGQSRLHAVYSVTYRGKPIHRRMPARNWFRHVWYYTIRKGYWRTYPGYPWSLITNELLYIRQQYRDIRTTKP